jgi:hypothetical protein
MEPKVMLQNPLPINPTLDPAIMLSPSQRMGYFVSIQYVSFLTITPTLPTAAVFYTQQ